MTFFNVFKTFYVHLGSSPKFEKFRGLFTHPVHKIQKCIISHFVLFLDICGLEGK